MTARRLKISVRELVGFVLRSGDLARGFGSAARLAEGTYGHQRVQRARPDSYRAEVPVSHQVEQGDLCLEIAGRIDGLWVRDERLVVEEIKTTEEALDGERPENPAHWAQAKVYAYILAVQHELPEVDVQLTYVQLESWEKQEQCRTFSLAELEAFFQDLVARYLHWARLYHAWCQERDQSIEALAFPFPEYRPGQRRLAGAVYRAIEGRTRLFAQAPTGIGKTISALFPAIKALGLGHAEKIFYLTAKTVGRTVAEKAIDDMRRSGLKLKGLTLTARDKICFNPAGEGSCDPEQCEFAIGYYDRVNQALEDLFQHQALTRPLIEQCARKHRVCPFEFSLDASLWADVVICDYNYVFDPRAYLKRFFLDSAGDYALLVDEAHNLVDRAREMFSADLYKSEVLGLKRQLHKDHPSLSKKLDALNRRFLALGRQVEAEGEDGTWSAAEAPSDLVPLLQSFLAEAEKVLARLAPAPYVQDLLDFYFRCLAFQRIDELFDEHYRAYAEKQGREIHLRLFCIDPAKNIREALKRGSSAAFFSATLTPLDYFRDLLGGEEGDVLLSLDSPFPRQNLRLLLADHLETTYRKRQETTAQVAEAIAAVVRQKSGNYLAYFPSYRYMEEVAACFSAAHPDIEIIVQQTGMSERRREEFLEIFDAENAHSLLGFAVMGGIFGEGIDLVGERLVGAVVVGVGLPQICLERELIRRHFDALQLSGFEYAYTFPGMNRVLQAAGRVIRTSADRGVVLLVDRRFGQSRYQRLFPPFWDAVHTVRDPAQIGLSLKPFWNGE